MICDDACKMAKWHTHEQDEWVECSLLAEMINVKRSFHAAKCWMMIKTHLIADWSVFCRISLFVLFHCLSITIATHRLSHTLDLLFSICNYRSESVKFYFLLFVHFMAHIKDLPLSFVWLFFSLAIEDALRIEKEGSWKWDSFTIAKRVE